MNKKKKHVRRRLTAWIVAVCLLSGTVSAGAAEDVSQENPGMETGLELAEAFFAEDEILSGLQAAGEVQELKVSENQTAENMLWGQETEGSGNESASAETFGKEDGDDPEAEILDIEDMGSLTAEEMALPVGPDDLTVEEETLLTVREAEASAYASPDLSGKFSEIYSKAGNYLYSTVTDPVVNSVGGEWAVFGLARAGYPAGNAYYAKYAKNVSDEVTRNGGVLSEVKYTEYSRVILGLTAAGYDACNVAGYDLTAPLADLDSVVWQGINGPIWALIALDSHGYEIRQAPAGKTQTTRQNLIGKILEGQLDDGGWSIAGFSADPDMTAMAIMALTPYYKGGDTWSVYGQSVTVRQAVDRALETLSSIQDASGGYISYNEPNSESCAQVLTALSEFGIDPEKDTRFQKNGRSVLDALLSYADSSGSFRHTLSTEVDGMSCEQAYYALAAYSRYLKGQKRLFDMTDVGTLRAVPKPEDFVLDPEPETEDNPGGSGSDNPGGNSGDGNDNSGGNQQGTNPPQTETPAAKDLKLNVKKVSLLPGDTYHLSVTFTPAGSKGKVAWNSQNKKVVTVDSDGMLTAQSEGTATVTAALENGKKVSCKVTVKGKPATKVTLNKKKASLKKGKKLKLKAVLTPGNASKKITWSSSNKKVAKVDKNGKVTALKKGKAVITVKTASGKKASCRITVS